MEFYRTDPIYMYTTISKNLITIPIPRSKFMLGSGTDLPGRFRLFPSVRYCVLPGAVWCGAVHTFSHTREWLSFGRVTSNKSDCDFYKWIGNTINGSETFTVGPIWPKNWVRNVLKMCPKCLPISYLLPVNEPGDRTKGQVGKNEKEAVCFVFRKCFVFFVETKWYPILFTPQRIFPPQFFDFALC